MLRHSIAVGRTSVSPERHDRQVERDAAGLVDALLDALGDLVEVRVARRQVGGGVGDRDVRPAVERVRRQAAPHPGPVDVGVAVATRRTTAHCVAEPRARHPLRLSFAASRRRHDTGTIARGQPMRAFVVTAPHEGRGPRRRAAGRRRRPGRRRRAPGRRLRHRRRVLHRRDGLPAPGARALPAAARPRVVRRGVRGRGRRRRGLARPPGHRRHDDRLRALRALPRPGGTTSARTGSRSASAGLAGALAEQMAVPASRAGRAARRGSTTPPARWSSRAATRCGRVRRGRRWRRATALLVLGTGTIGLLVGRVRPGPGRRRAPGRRPTTARSRWPATLGFAGVWRTAELPALPLGRGHRRLQRAPSLPALALDLVEPGKRVVYIGLAGSPSLVDTRDPGHQGRHRRRHPGRVDAGWRRRSSSTPTEPSTRTRWSRRRSASTTSGECWPAGARTAPGPGPKIHLDPRA